jgi:hypothetical protein
MKKTNVKKILRVVALSAALSAGFTATSKAEPALLDLSKAPVADANTVLLLHFDEGQGSEVVDASTNARKAAISGAQWADGKFGKALRFDGDDDFIDMGGAKSTPPQFDFDATTDFTVDFWMKTTSEKKVMYLLSKKLVAGEREPGYHIYMSGPDINAIISDGTNRVVLRLRTPLRDGQWHHIALVAERKGNAALYVDGKAGPTAAMEAIGDVTSSRRPLRIGDRNSSEADDFEGELDEVRLSNLARKFAVN